MQIIPLLGSKLKLPKIDKRERRFSEKSYEDG